MNHSFKGLAGWLLMAVAVPANLSSSMPNGASGAVALTLGKPAGIYAVVPFDDGSGSTNDFPMLLQNPAVAGLALRIQWQTMQPQPTQYEFSIIQQALSQAAAQNKSVQLILLPGFFSPAWLLTNLVSYDQFPTTNSGKAFFTAQEGQYQGQRMELPFPWNSTYKTAWHNFLLELQRRFGGASNLVSIAVTGPTSTSAEMNMPQMGSDLTKWGNILALFFPPGPYQDSDQIFIDEWDAAIDFYNQTFQDLTMIVTRGSGLLSFHPGDANAARDQIINYFAGAPHGTNLRATQTSGLKACRDNTGGIEGAKSLALSTAYLPFTERILAGAQFNSSATKHPLTMGCPSPDCDCAGWTISPAQAMTNVLHNYFNGTPVGAQFGATNGPAPVQYLQIYETDIFYANTSAAVQAALMMAASALVELNTGFRAEDCRWVGGIFQLALDTEPGHEVVIEASRDLQTWAPVTTFTNAPSPIQWQEGSSTNFPARFYRANVVLP